VEGAINRANIWTLGNNCGCFSLTRASFSPFPCLRQVFRGKFVDALKLAFQRRNGHKTPRFRRQIATQCIHCHSGKTAGAHHDQPAARAAHARSRGRACLAKDPADRFQSAHDVAMGLRWMADSTPTESTKISPQFNKSWTAVLAALLLAFVALGAFGGYRWARSSEEAVSIHGEILPDKFSMDSTGDSGGMPVLSPQGDKIAFVAHSGENKLLWVRSLSSEAAQALNGTNGASHPFWSPDGRYIGFFAGGKLIKIPATGGPIAALALDMLTVVLTEDRLHSSSEWPLCSPITGQGRNQGGVIGRLSKD
jgi:hypothetical protein